MYTREEEEETFDVRATSRTNFHQKLDDVDRQNAYTNERANERSSKTKERTVAMSCQCATH